MNQLSNIITFVSHSKVRTKLRHFALSDKAQVRPSQGGPVCHWVLNDATGKLHCNWLADACDCSDEAQSLLRLTG